MSDYLFLEDFEVLKTQIYSSKKNQYSRLAEQCERYSNMYLPAVHPNESTTYMGMAIANLSLMYILSREPKYLKEAKRFIFRVCDYECWGNAHLVNVDLSASWILFGLSLGYDWLKRDLSVEERTIIYNKLVLQSKIMYDYKVNTEGNGWSTCYYQNHNWINMCGLAACGYALKAEYAQAVNYLKSARDNFNLVYNLFAEDGSNYEGVVYWRYGGMWLFIYAHLLKNEEGINLFETSDYLKNTFYYRLYQSASDFKRQLNFGDCHDRYSGHTPCVYYKVASEYADGYAQYFGNLVVNNFLYEEQYQSKVKPGILPEAWLELLWYNPQIKEKSLEDLPLVRKFDDLGLVCIRNGFKEDSTVFSFKCGYPGGKKQWENGWRIKKELNWNILALSHHHPDNNSFILNKGKAYFVVDEGYNRNILPANHNILLVDGETCEVSNVNDVYMSSVREILKYNANFDPVKEFYGELINYCHDDTLTFFEGETHLTYKKSLNMLEVSRFVITNDLKYIIMLDTLRSKDEHIYQTILNTDVYPTKLSNNYYLYTDVLEKMHYQVYSDKEVETVVFEQSVKSVMTTQEPDKCCETVLKSLSLCSKNKEHEQQFFHIMTLDDNIVINYKKDYIEINSNCEEYIIFKDSLGFKTDAKILYVKIMNKKIFKVGLIEGSYLNYQGQDLIKLDQKGTFVRGDINEIFE